MLDPVISRKIEEQKKTGGIDLSKLKVGTRVEAMTKNTLYKITVLGEGMVKIQGGKYFPEPTETHFNGSTWGGSILKIGWIGYGMHMEIQGDDGPLLTTPVKTAVIYSDDWEYRMEWP